MNFIEKIFRYRNYDLYYFIIRNIIKYTREIIQRTFSVIFFVLREEAEEIDFANNKREGKGHF